MKHDDALQRVQGTALMMTDTHYADTVLTLRPESQRDSLESWSRPRSVALKAGER